MCEGLRQEGHTRLPRGLHGISQVFRLYTNAINRKLAESLDYDSRSQLVQKALQIIVSAFPSHQTQWLPRENAMNLVDSILPDRSFHNSLYQGLVGEGLLVEDFIRIKQSEKQEFVHLGYERLADHLTAELLLEACQQRQVSETASAIEPTGQEGRLSSGVLESLFIQAPEKLKQELMDFLPSILKHWQWADAYASQLRPELGLRNRRWAQGRAHVESYGDPPVIVYAPEGRRHGNFFDPAYAEITGRPEWMWRFGKIHAQGRSLPKAERRWRELDSSMSSDALLMNVFCAPGVANSVTVRRALWIEGDEPPIFGWKARVPLASEQSDRTEVDMRLGLLLVEAKLTEGDFQTKAATVVEGYRDFDAVFERELLLRVELVTKRRREATEFPEDYSQEFSTEKFGSARETSPTSAAEVGYAGYQLIRNVLAAYAEGCSFCVVHDDRRPDLREAWFKVMAAELRVRLSVLTRQELAALLPEELQEFLDLKYGIARPGRQASPVDGHKLFD